MIPWDLPWTGRTEPVRDDELIRPWFDEAFSRVPSLSLFDAHTHIGSNDPDGMRLSHRELLTTLDMVSARAVVIPMHEPDGYRAANDHVLAVCERSGGRLVPFCRIDPSRHGAAEARRCIEAGARGIKLHPRAENFELSAPAVASVVALASDHRLPVLIHAGRGIPTLGRDALELARRYPSARLILAHAAICDLNWIWREAGGHPNLFFDTSWWHSTDLAALFALIRPGQILYGSDPPYFSPMLIATCVIRTALQAGIGEDQLRAIGGGQLERLLAGQDPLDLGPAPGHATTAPSILLERINSMLLLAVSRMLLGDTGYEPLALARLACDVGSVEAPEAEVCRNVLALLDLHDREAAQVAEGDGFSAPGIGLVMLAANITRTPDVPLPAVSGLTTEDDVRNASRIGHRLIDFREPRRLSAIFPAIELTAPHADQESIDLRDIRRSSAADHLMVDVTRERPYDPRRDRGHHGQADASG